MNCIKVIKKDVLDAVELRLERVGVRARVVVEDFGVEVRVYSTSSALALAMRNAVAAAMSDIYISEVSQHEVERPLFTMTSLADAERTVKESVYDKVADGYFPKNRSLLNARFVRNVIAK